MRAPSKKRVVRTLTWFAVICGSIWKILHPEFHNVEHWLTRSVAGAASVLAVLNLVDIWFVGVDD